MTPKNYFYLTGTSSGIGLALAKALLESPENFVYGIGRNKKIIHSNYGHYFLDLAELEEVSKFHFDKSRYTGNESVVLINNAATLGQVLHMGKREGVEIAREYAVNLTAPTILMNRFLSAYKSFAGNKVILNVSSGAGRHPIESWATYCAAKAGLDMASLVADHEQRTHNSANPARVFSVAPGIVDTPMQDVIRQTQPEEFSEVARFQGYKEHGSLTDPKAVAAQLLKILRNPDNYDKVLLDLRDL